MTNAEIVKATQDVESAWRAAHPLVTSDDGWQKFYEFSTSPGQNRKQWPYRDPDDWERGYARFKQYMENA